MILDPLDQKVKNLSRPKVYTRVAVVCDTKQKKRCVNVDNKTQLADFLER